ncbi:MAG: penicillin-binding protein 2 [Planctomycetes bacterium]|nr:penicillin-binding protein 2 [Planctomycetota bacterium]
MSKLFWAMLVMDALCIGQYMRISRYSDMASELQIRNTTTHLYNPSYRLSIVDKNCITISGSSVVNELYYDPVAVSKQHSVEGAVSILKEHYDVSDDELVAALSQINSNKRFVSVTNSFRTRDKNPKGFYVRPICRRTYEDYKSHKAWLGFSDQFNDAHEGFELYYDKLFKFLDEKLYATVDGKRRVIETELKLQESYIVVTTIDSLIQSVAFEVASEYLEQLKCEYIGILGIDPNNGEILCYLSVENDGFKSRNPLAVDSNEPGSILKPFAVLCAMENKTFNSERLINCQGTRYFGRRKISCHKAHGTIKASQILTYSCNIGAVEIAQDVSFRNYRKFLAENTMFAKKTGIDLPFEDPGYLPKESEWSSYTHTSIPIGYEIRTTALQMAVSYSALCNGGYLVQPHILKEVRTFRNSEVYEKSSQKRKLNLSDENLESVKNMLESVIAQGTGSLHRYKQIRYSGKTGTARIFDRSIGQYVSEYNSSFVSYAPADKPQILLYVIVHKPKPYYFASVTAVPIAMKIYQRLDKELKYFRGIRDEVKN